MKYFGHSVTISDDFTDDVTLWRYTPFPQFCAALSNSGLFFSRASTFKDPWEASYPASFMDPERWRSWLMANNHQAQELGLDLGRLSTHLVRDLQESIARRNRFFVSCWHESDFESEPFWRLYSDPQFGIAIRTTVEALGLSLMDAQHRVHVARVRYEAIDDPSAEIAADFVPILHKRRDFAHEARGPGIHIHSQRRW